MAKNERKRQKQLAAKKKKRKQKKSNSSGLSVAEPSISMKSFEQAERYPIRECLVADDIFLQGMGHVIVARDLPTGDVAVGAFLVDSYCLGVKDAFLKGFNLFDYRDFVENNPSQGYDTVAPAYAKKLVDDVLAFSENLGFRPHKDYKKAKYIFGAVDSSECVESFEFGKDGKPYYISGPFDSSQKVEKIRRTLTKSCGEDGFDIMIVSGGELDFEDFEQLEFIED